MDRNAVLMDVRSVADEVLQLGGRGHGFDAGTPLLGAVPELDSAAVVMLLAALEERFDMVVEDDEITADTFETLGSLSDYVARKISA